MCTTSNKLNRSSSESDLHKANFGNLSLQDSYYDRSGTGGHFITKRVLLVEEVIQSDTPDIFRRGTSYQVFGRSTPDRLQNLECLVGNMLNNPFSNNSTFTATVNDQLHTNIGGNNSTLVSSYNRNSVVPMETDILPDTYLKSDDRVDFVEAMDMDIDLENETNNTSFNHLENVIKKRNLSKQPIESTIFTNRYIPEGSSRETNTTITPITCREKRLPKYSTCILMLVLIFILTLVYVVFFPGIVLYVNSDVQYENVQKDLLENVHGQNASVEAVVRNLQQRKRWDRKIKVLSFVGPTGIGKTFVANIIKRHFLQELAHEIFGMHLKYESRWNRIVSALKSCCLNLIVIDDLKKKDTIDLFAFIHSLPQDQFVLVISIFNIQYTNDKIDHKINYTDIVEIRNEFDNSGLYYEVIIFKEFNNDEVKDWMQKQIRSQNIELKLQDRILENVLRGHETRYEGLKGLYSKLLLEVEKYAH